MCGSIGSWLLNSVRMSELRQNATANPTPSRDERHEQALAQLVEVIDEADLLAVVQPRSRG